MLHTVYYTYIVKDLGRNLWNHQQKVKNNKTYSRALKVNEVIEYNKPYLTLQLVQ